MSVSEDIQIVGRIQTDTIDREKQEAARVAQYVAPELAAIAVPHPDVRQDVGNVQVDFGYAHWGATKHEPICRLSWRLPGDFGAEINIKLAEFRVDPAGYINDLLKHLGPMYRNAQKLRVKKQHATDAIYRALGANHG
ncbi:hypothetical protein [Salinicola sp. DM10]|uniref:hypothetical protein n=1 Tax=Salinicola sp. DM10 TaxID=2815721 RepID=UPI001A8DCEB0|nr:hypothetical protein [Salinicola sp. DM10]MCE3025736.1 hypothetical protein [Salinicola sp. DM10]